MSKFGLRATLSVKFDIATVVLPRDQKNEFEINSRIIRDSRVRDNETFYREVDQKFWREQGKSSR